MQMQIQLCGDAGGIAIDKGEPCRFPKLQECAHFHYERVQLCPLQIYMQTNPTDLSLHSQHEDPSEEDWYTVQVTSNDECWLLKRSYDNFVKLDSQLHQCIYDRKISQLPELTQDLSHDKIEETLNAYLQRFCKIVDNSLNCGPVLTWFQLDNKGHRLLVPNEESDSINTPAVAAAYSIKKYVSQARDELNLEVGDMISVIDMASPGESMWWRGKRGFQVGFFPQHCVHVIGEKLACLPHAPLALGSTASPIKPVLRKHGKLVAFFRNFILNRPSRRRLKQSGILRERVFGCDLGEHLLNSGHEIPMVLKCCAEFIESHGLVDGIYRLSGVTSNIQKLRNAFDEDRIPNLYTEDILQDIHSVASLLKMYFRELPNPLCTYQLYHSFVSAVQGSIDSSGGRNKINENERLLRMREVVHKLPPPHYRTLEYLMRHLARVAKHGARTGMTSRNVAIVWAPNLLRCAELEVGGVAALQGVGVQAVVTEFLVCYTDLIFCENPPAMQLSIEEPSSLSPKKLRPKSLAISTPTKLLTLEEARSKHLLNKSEECNYIEVGGGPKNLPEKYHTVLELPQGFRKRGFSKRSPSGWRSFFSKSRNSTTHGSLNKNLRKASTPGIIIEKSLSVEPDLNEIKRKLRPVKSAESLTSGQSEVVSCEIDVLGPLTCLTKPTGHNRSVSHDSYFDTLQTSNHNSEGSLLDLSEIQLNFELEESEMRIFSEDESLVSSPRVQKEKVQKKVLSRVHSESVSNTINSNNPSPKKQARIVTSPDSQSRKRSRLEDQLSDILYIDCSTPENAICTTAIVHSIPESNSFEDKALTVEPRNKSPRNSDEISPLDVKGTRGELGSLDVKKYQFTGRSKNRNSLNLESRQCIESVLPKSLTEYNIHGALQIPDGVPSEINSTNLTPQTPNYKRLIGETDSSDTNTPNQISPDFSLTESPTDISYVNLNRFSGESQKFDELAMADKKNDVAPSNTYENIVEDLTDRLPASPTYENVLTTISITYKSPTKSKSFDIPLTKDGNIYEDVDINAEMKAQIPTSVANLPSKEARQPDLIFSGSKVTNLDEALSQQQNDSSSSKSISASIQSLSSTCVDGQCCGSSHGSRSSIVLDSCCSLTTKCTDINDSDTQLNLSRNSNENIYENVLSPKSGLCSPVKSSISINGGAEKRASFDGTSMRNVNFNEKRKSCETEGCNDEDAIYQQVKYFRRSIHEINELLDKPFTVTECKNTSSSVGNLTVANNIKEIKKGSNSLQNLNSTKSVDNSVNNVNKTEIIVSQNMSEDRNALKDDLSNDLLEQNIILDKQESKDKITENEIKQNSITEDSLMSEENGEIKSFDQIAEVKDIVINNDDCNNTEECEKMVTRIVKDDGTSIVENKTDEDIVEDSSEKFDSLEINNTEKNEGCNEKQNLNEESLSNRSDEDKCKSSASLPNSRKQSLQSSKTAVYSAALNVRELATKFEQIDNNSDGILIRHKNDVFSGRDSLPPCLRAKHAKLTKNNSRARSLDENAFVKEFGNSSQHLKKVSIIESLSRRKSLDERLNRIGTSQPKLLNQPKKLPDIGTVAPEIHLSHSRQSVETVNASRTKTNESEDKKTTVDEHSSTNSLSDSSESKSNAAGIDHSMCDAAPSLSSSVVSDCHSDNPQLNRERIEKYKEERRNFLREKYRSESFRADKDQLLSRLKQKSKTKLDSESSDVATDSLEYSDIVDSASDNLTKCRIDKSDYCLDQSRYKRPSDKSTDSYKKPTSFSNRFSTDIYSKNTDTVDDKKLDTKQTFSNQRLKKNYRLNPTEQEAVQKSVKTKANDGIASECLDTSVRLTQQGKENMLHDLQFKNVDDIKAVPSEKSRNILHRKVGDSTESPFLRRKESDSARRKDSEKSAIGDIRTARGHSFDLMSRERDLDTERNRKISLESRLSSRSPKKEKRSPSYCIKDMTAMFESKSNQS